jgi:hypothetical protein
MSYNYDWTRDRRRSINEDAVIDLTFPDEADIVNKPPKREPTVHDGYITWKNYDFTEFELNAYDRSCASTLKRSNPLI